MNTTTYSPLLSLSTSPTLTESTSPTSSPTSSSSTSPTGPSTPSPSHPSRPQKTQKLSPHPHTKKLSNKKLSPPQKLSHSNKKLSQKLSRKEDAYKEVVAEGTMIDDKDATTLTDFHEHQRQHVADSKMLEEKGVETITKATGGVREQEAGFRRDKPVQITSRIEFQESKVKLSRLPFWYLCCFGSFSRSERLRFLDTYRDELNENEIIANNLLDRVLAGDKDAEKIYWDMQMKVMNKTNVVNQINVAVQKPDSIVSSLLDDIASRIAEGKVETPPTPQNL